MGVSRTERLNSLLRQVISDVIAHEVKNPHLPSFITITHVEVTKDLGHAKVYISVIGDKEAKEKALQVLKSAARFIAHHASQEVKLRHFPELAFYIDDAAEKQQRIDDLLNKIHEEEKKRGTHDSE